LIRGQLLRIGVGRIRCQESDRSSLASRPSRPPPPETPSETREVRMAQPGGSHSQLERRRSSQTAKPCKQQLCFQGVPTRSVALAAARGPRPPRQPGGNPSAQLAAATRQVVLPGGGLQACLTGTPSQSSHLSYRPLHEASCFRRHLPTLRSGVCGKGGAERPCVRGRIAAAAGSGQVTPGDADPPHVPMHEREVRRVTRKQAL